MIERERFQKEPIPPDVRWAVWERDDFRCHYCGNRSWLSVDHVIAESKGGPMTLSNLVTACQDCNRRKHAKSYEAFLRGFYTRDVVTRMLWSSDDYETRLAALEGQAEVLQNSIEDLRSEYLLRYPKRNNSTSLSDPQRQRDEELLQRVEELLGFLFWLSALDPKEFIQELARQWGEESVCVFGQFLDNTHPWLMDLADALDRKFQSQDGQPLQAAD